jgi:hypothetical protein
MWFPMLKMLSFGIVVAMMKWSPLIRESKFLDNLQLDHL